MYKESDIMHENGSFWVLRESKRYTVCQSGFTHSTTIQSFERSADGLSLAVAYCDYRAKATKR